MAKHITGLLSLISLCVTAQAFVYVCKDAKGKEIIPINNMQDLTPKEYKFMTPGYPARWGEGVHCIWHSDRDPHTPQYRANCTIDFTNNVAGTPCDHEAPSRVEAHYLTDRGAPAKDVWCSPTEFIIDNIKLLDVFVAPGADGAVLCDLVNLY